MHAGREAQLFVPRLLSVLADSATARHSWGQGWAQVPLHVLLPWVAQMLSVLDAVQGDALLPALQVSQMLNAAQCKALLPTLLLPEATQLCLLTLL